MKTTVILVSVTFPPMSPCLKLHRSIFSFILFFNKLWLSYHFCLKNSAFSLWVIKTYECNECVRNDNHDHHNYHTCTTITCTFSNNTQTNMHAHTLTCTHTHTHTHIHNIKFTFTHHHTNLRVASPYFIIISFFFALFCFNQNWLSLMFTSLI